MIAKYFYYKFITKVLNLYDTETYRLILDFSNSANQLASGYYYTSIFINDNNSSLEDEETENATNIVQAYVYDREYSYDGALEKSYYMNDETVEINGTLSISASEMEETGKDLYAKISLFNSDGNIIDIPKGTIVYINGEEGEIFRQSASGLIIESLSNDEISQDLEILIDMENVIEQNLLPSGTYSMKVELVLAKYGYLENTVQSETIIDLNLAEWETNEYGLNTSIDLTDDDNIQLIEYEVEESRTIKLAYNTENLESSYIKITRLEKTGEFTYEQTDNSDLISVYIGDTEIAEDVNYVLSNETSSLDIEVNFGTNIEEGTYRIYCKLYDQYGNELTEDFVGFIVYD